MAKPKVFLRKTYKPDQAARFVIETSLNGTDWKQLASCTSKPHAEGKYEGFKQGLQFEKSMTNEYEIHTISDDWELEKTQ